MPGGCTRRRALHRPPPLPLIARGHVGQTGTIVGLRRATHPRVDEGAGAGTAAGMILGGRCRNAQRVFRAAALRARGGGVDRGATLRARAISVRSAHRKFVRDAPDHATSAGRPPRTDPLGLPAARGAPITRDGSAGPAVDTSTARVSRRWLSHGMDRGTWSRRSPIPNQTETLPRSVAPCISPTLDRQLRSQLRRTLSKTREVDDSSATRSCRWRRSWGGGWRRRLGGMRPSASTRRRW